MDQKPPMVVRVERAILFGIGLAAASALACSGSDSQQSAGGRPENTGTVGLSLQVAPDLSLSQAISTIHNPLRGGLVGPVNSPNCEGPTVCAAGVTRCSGSGLLQTCSGDGKWISVSCSSSDTCVNGACVGTATAPGTSCQGFSASGPQDGSAAAVAESSSFQPGLTNCGANQESCCTSLAVPGGTYHRTYTNSGTGPTGQADPATVSGFRLDKYLVTVGRFRRYVKYLTGSTGAPPANGSGIHTYLNGGQGLANSGSAGTYETGWDATDWDALISTGAGAASTWNANLACDPTYATWTTTAGSQENLPVNCVNWAQAYAFCIWDGGFLPSEAEWEYVAAGGNQELEYPWGSAAPGTASQYAIYDSNYTANSVGIAPVGATVLGTANWGQLDMAGEVWEWTLDGYAPYVDPCTNCAYLSTAPGQVIRGGAYYSSAAEVVPAHRSERRATVALFYDVGFRCARSAP
jgi:sulfatase modifying factor 1